MISGNLYYGVSDAGSGDLIAGNLVGLNASATGPLGNGDAGVLVGGTGNTVGGLTATAGTGLGNVISGNVTGSGIGMGGTGNVAVGNLIGTDPTGLHAFANGDGVFIRAFEDTVGGTAAGAHNVISGNGNGIDIDQADSTENVVEGNYIGTDISGSLGWISTGVGIGISYGSASNTIGGTAAGAGNVISGNALGGVYLGNGGAGTSGDVVEGNLIGTDSTGTVSLGNGGNGVYAGTGTSDVTIGRQPRPARPTSSRATPTTGSRSPARAPRQTSSPATRSAPTRPVRLRYQLRWRDDRFRRTQATPSAV